MAHLSLPGGTDVAEVALFSVDALPTDAPRDAGVFDQLEAEHTAIRFPTGADGAYLLQVFIDEPIPEPMLAYVVEADKKTGRLNIRRGNLGFGGLESAHAGFVPDRMIRSDTRIPPGEYDVVAYRTVYPTEIIEGAVRARISSRGRLILELPSYIIPAAILLTITAFVLSGWIAATAVAISAVAVLAAYFRNGVVRRLQSEKLAVETAYPSILVEMRSVRSDAIAASMEP